MMKKCDWCNSTYWIGPRCNGRLCSTQCFRDKKNAYMREWNRKNKDRLRPLKAAYNKKWRDSNLEDRRTAEREGKKRYLASHPDQKRSEEARRRARKANVSAICFKYVDIMERDNWTCYECGKQVTLETCHIDHLVPLALGGSHAPYNVSVSCSHCNVTKGADMTRKAIQQRGQNMMDALALAVAA